MDSLAVKYRPICFTELVGQEPIKQILKNQLEQNEIKSGYLFKGGAGTGKTTTARLLANMLNATVIEINGANANGVDDIRTLIDDAVMKPVSGTHKVYIIDEVHMLSKGAFNCLLKILEEPPKHVIFILCTTDPNKIPKTILSRVQRFDFKRIPTELIVENMRDIIAKENNLLIDASVQIKQAIIEYDLPALEYIAKLADGGMRDALTLLDTAIAYDKHITLANLYTCLDRIDYDLLLDMLDCILAQDAKDGIKLINKAYENGLDLKLFVEAMTSYLIDICKIKITDSYDYSIIPKQYLDDTEDLIESENLAVILSILDVFIELNNKLKYDNKPKYLIEFSLINLCK